MLRLLKPPPRFPSDDDAQKTNSPGPPALAERDSRAPFTPPPSLSPTGPRPTPPSTYEDDETCVDPSYWHAHVAGSGPSLIRILRDTRASNITPVMDFDLGELLARLGEAARACEERLSGVDLARILNPIKSYIDSNQVWASLLEPVLE